MNKKTILLIIASVVVVAIADAYFWTTMKSAPLNTASSPSSSSTPPSAMCLSSGETASYVATRNKKAPDVSTVSIMNTSTGSTVSKFQISDVISDHYHAYEIHSCAIYVFRKFNYDYTIGVPLSNYSQELWKYTYDGMGTKLVQAYDYRVSPDESILAFSPFYDSLSNPSVVFENLQTGRSIFTLHLADVPASASSSIANFDYENGGWSADSRYMWLDSNEAADVLGFMRIDTKDWSHQIFPAPSVTMGGDALNPDTGMVTYRTNAAPWTADAEIDQQYRDAAAQSGQVSSFNIYDLLTNKIYVVATTTDPTYYYQPHWISDTVLGYTLPSGATTTYTISSE